MKSFTTGVQKVYKKTSFQKAKNDFAFWQTQSYLARLAALEQIRQEFHRWRQDAEPGLQRVYTITKR